MRECPYIAKLGIHLWVAHRLLTGEVGEWCYGCGTKREGQEQ